jgi:hypothetical protein
MRVAVVPGPGPWSGATATQEAVARAWAAFDRTVDQVAWPDPLPRPIPGRRLGSEAVGEAAADPLSDRLTGADLVIGLFDAVEFRDGGGPALARLARAAATVQAPLVVLTPRLEISKRELRVLGVEAAYAIDLADPAGLGRIALTWSW